MTDAPQPASNAGGEPYRKYLVNQHIGWLKQYIEGMTADNWQDMRLHAERQLERLCEDFDASAYEAKEPDEDHPDCVTDREFELFDALMGIASHAMAYYPGFKNWMQGGIHVAPIVRRALRLDGPSVSSTDRAIDIPAGVYFSPEASNFYHVETKRGCGNDFYSIWKDHWRAFPQSEAAALPSTKRDGEA